MNTLTTAPRVTTADVLATIESEHIFTGADGVIGNAFAPPISSSDLLALSHVTICVLILKNGHKIIGVNEGSVSPTLFDAELGRRKAREAAIDRIWPLLGYQLRERVHNHSKIAEFFLRPGEKSPMDLANFQGLCELAVADAADPECRQR